MSGINNFTRVFLVTVEFMRKKSSPKKVLQPLSNKRGNKYSPEPVLLLQEMDIFEVTLLVRLFSIYNALISIMSANLITAFIFASSPELQP